MEHDNFEDVLVSSIESLKQLLLTEHRRSVRHLEESALRRVAVGATTSGEGSGNLVTFKCIEAPNDLSAPSLFGEGNAVGDRSEHSPLTHHKGNKTNSSILTTLASTVSDGQDEVPQCDQEKMLYHVMAYGSLPQMARDRISFVNEASIDRRVEEEQATFLGYWVDQFMNFIVVANVCVMGVSADVRPRWRGWFIINVIFAVIYVLEVIIKLYFQGLRVYFRGPDWRWSVLESSLAVLAVVEIAVMEIQSQEDRDIARASFLRVLRLFRVIKILRMMRMEIFSELSQMIEGTLGGVRTLLWSLVLLLIPVYMVALILRESLGQHASEKRGAEPFASFPDSFFTISRCVVTGDCSNSDGRPIFVLVTQNYGWAYGAFYLLFMVFCIFGIFNVIASIFVEKAVAASKYNYLVKKRNRLQSNLMLASKAKEICLAVFRVGWNSSNGSRLLKSKFEKVPEDLTLSDMETLARTVAGMSITAHMWAKLREESGFPNILIDLDISLEDQDVLFETVDADGGGTITVLELILAICKLRGDPRRSDIISVNMMTHHIHSAVTEAKDETVQLLAKQSKILQSVLRMLRNLPCYEEAGARAEKVHHDVPGCSTSTTVRRKEHLVDFENRLGAVENKTFDDIEPKHAVEIDKAVELFLAEGVEKSDEESLGTAQTQINSVHQAKSKKLY